MDKKTIQVNTEIEQTKKFAIYAIQEMRRIPRIRVIIKYKFQFTTSSNTGSFRR